MFGQIIYEKINGSNRENYYLGSQLVAHQGAGAITFIHPDVLGTSAGKTDSNGNLVKRVRYAPFGLEWGKTNASSGENEIGYTGHKHDKSIGLTYMQARYYDPVIGRFYSNDPVDAATFLSQGNMHGFNRYSYANNNPYKYIDPDGRESIFRQQLHYETMKSVPGYHNASKRLAKASTLRASLGGLGFKAGYKSPNSPLQADLGAEITPAAKLDNDGLHVEIMVEAAFEATAPDGSSAKGQIGKVGTSLQGGEVTTISEGPNLEVSPATSGTLQGDGIMKVNGKLGPVKVEYELNTNEL
ncbi:MAG: RHS repeat-associated core domain-containing protein [Alteromonas stellipolaris]